MRAAPKRCKVGQLVLALPLLLGGCDKLKRSDPAQAGKARAETRRQQAACGSGSAADRLKNLLFDHAIADRHGNRANLDVLADYSVGRLQDPVVKGWDRSLDITRCRGRFILDVPPGAERAFAGEHELQADIEYTAQASADGNGFVYQQNGAEPIVAKLAAFNLGAESYRPPPAIDRPSAVATVAAESAAMDAEERAESLGAAPQRRAAVVPLAPVQDTHPVGHASVAERTVKESVAPVALRSPSRNGEATVRAFYGALNGGNGAAASSQVIPEKRWGAYSPGEMSRFYGHLREPIRLTTVRPLPDGAFRVTYHYSAGRSRCDGRAVVRLTKRGGRSLIRSIQALNGC